MKPLGLASLNAALAAGLCAVLAAQSLGGEPPRSSRPDADPGVRERNVQPQFSYAIGLGIGRKLREIFQEDGLKAEYDLIVRGLSDGLNEKSPLFPEHEMEQAINRIEAIQRQRQAEKRYAEDPAFRKLADENLQRSREALAQAANMVGVEKLPSGLLVRTIKQGDGRFVANAATMKVNYRLSLGDKTLVRMSKPGTPATIRLSLMPPAMAAAAQETRVGGKYQVGLPPELAYGLGGLPPVVGPNQALLLEFEIVSVD